ncbi:MAG: PucR family transcriptional regulator, partial [Bacillota bacterium]|nr:PucR family transcriptional regulator [Bacillota bacterium]
MYNFRNYLEELSESSGIGFRLVGEDETTYFDGSGSISEDKICETQIYLGKNKALIIMDKRYEVCAPLLKYSIESKYRELFSMREQSLIDILEGKEVGINKLEKDFPFLLRGCTLFLVSIDGSRYE